MASYISSLLSLPLLQVLVFKLYRLQVCNKSSFPFPGCFFSFLCNPLPVFCRNNMAADSFLIPPCRKIQIREAKEPNRNRSDSSGVEEPQDADYPYVPQLSGDIEKSILARFPRSEYWKLNFLNKHFSRLVKSGELFKIRRQIGFKESSIFMSASGGNCWWAFDRLFKCCRQLPELPSRDVCFIGGDKESLCAGSHLIVSGREFTEGNVVWRFELETSKWFKGPLMTDPRCLFASATCGTFGFVAGGIEMGLLGAEVLNSAEKYNPETKSWESLPCMHKKRKLCSGCFMDDKFYVIGGKDEKDMELTCGEAYNKDKNTWELIPDMLKDNDNPVAKRQSPPLLAVVNNELYCLETSSNELKVYLKKTNTWKKLGAVPVRADLHKGWGVAFKSLGNKLLVIGYSSAIANGNDNGKCNGMTIYTCRPEAEREELRWRCVEGYKDRLNFFLLNCCVMVA